MNEADIKLDKASQLLTWNNYDRISQEIRAREKAPETQPFGVPALTEKSVEHEGARHSGSDETTPISTRELFGDAHEIVIDHEGSLYRLRITRQGKLILNK